MEHESSGFKTLLTFVGGIAVGYGVALLFAPRSGRETRQMISEYANNTSERISDMARSAMDSARQAADRVSQRASDYADKASSTVSSAANRTTQ